MGAVQTLMEISVYAAVIFAVILLLRWALKERLSPALRYALWFLLLARLVFPITLESGLHPFEAWGNGAGVATVDLAAGEAADTAVTPVADEGVAAVQPAAEGAAQPERADLPAGRSLFTRSVLPVVWLSGAVVVGGWLALSYARFRRNIKRDAVQPSAALTEMLERIKSELGVRSGIRVVCQPAYGAPAIVFPGVLWIPLSAMAGMEEVQTEDALRHELMHVKRLDPAVTVLLAALCAVYWFHPAVWIAACLMRQDMEAACDAQVTKRYSAEQKRRYAALLVDLYAQPDLRAPALGFSGQGAKRQAERRVRSVFTAKKSGRGAALIAALTAVLLLFGCFTTACRSALAEMEDMSSPANPWPLYTETEIIGRVDAEQTQISQEATFAVHADIVQPKGASPAVISMTRQMTTQEEIYKSLTGAISLREPADTLNEALQVFIVGPDMERTGLSWGNPAIQSFQSYSGAVLIYTASEQRNGGYLGMLSDVLLNEPINLTVDEAQHQADAVVAALGAENLLLQTAERACLADSRVDATLDITSNGWCFTYVPIGGGLPVYCIDGLNADWHQGESVQTEADRARLRIYVNEGGVRVVDLGSMFDAGEVLDSSPKLVSYENAIDLAKQRLKQKFDDEDTVWPWIFASGVELTVERVNLVSAIVAQGSMHNSETNGMDDFDWRLIPVWQVIVSIAYEGAEPYRAIELRFSALDGLPLEIRF
ncbi:MAG: M56 family metallopeptidase [Clostridiales bacterium]|nr:M56 family metallopeptidase [Clostridiales bacterium]